MDGEEELRGDGEEIGLEDRESELAKVEREVGVDRGRRDVSHESNDVQWPEIVILQALPEPDWADGLPIM